MRSVSSCEACSDLEHALGQTRRVEAFGEALGAQRRLRGMLEHHRVAGHERRHHAVHGDQVRVVPRGDGEDHAQRLAPHEAREILLGAGVEIRERLRRDGDHVARALERAAHFVGRVTRGPAHLPGELFGDLRAALLELVAEAREDRGAFGERRIAPVDEGVARRAQGFVDLLRGRERALDVDAPVHRAHGLLDRCE